METLLDKLRRHELAPTPRMVDVLLRSGDALKELLASHRDGGGEPVDTDELVQDIRELASGRAAPPAAPAVQSATTPDVTAPLPPPAPAAGCVATPGSRVLELTVDPLPDPAVADALQELFREVVDLGCIEPLDAGATPGGSRRFKVVTRSPDDELLDLFSFHVDRRHLHIAPLADGGVPQGPASVPAANAAGADLTGDGFGFFADAPGAPSSLEAQPAPQSSAVAGRAPSQAASPAPARAKARSATSGGAENTLRVSVERIDQLINLVGELVITQAVLAQTTADLDPALHQQLAAGLADLERNTRDLQESVMSIRMIPMSVVFNRFPRMLRELAGKLGKKVDFVTQGEATELDKGMIEKITDPLTHLVRNSCDHGIETPAERLARGKPETGTITLAASHQGGNIVIEVRDDGKGLNRAKLLAKARDKGLEVSEAMSDAEVWNLIFAPGFSTAEQVTDVSGRGVGMDVVKKNITALGGTVEIDSAEGFGMTVRVRLPLTLAIMEGMSVGVAGECYILPLSSVVESFQPQAERVRTIGGGDRVVRVRDEYLPVIELEQLFGVPRDAGQAPAEPLMVVLESDGRRVAAVVDELLGQQQVVVKNLETNYQRVDNVAGATIMGDGRVALILDVGAIVHRACQRSGSHGAARAWS